MFSLAFVQDRELQRKALNIFAEYQPFVLAEVLQLNLFPSEQGSRSVIIGGLRRVLVDFDANTREFVESPTWRIVESLSRTNDPAVLDVTEGLPDHRWVQAARFRNGDLSSGLEWMTKEVERGEFLPFIQYSLLEQAIDQFALLFDGQREVVLSHLSQLSNKTDLAMLKATMAFAGYLQWPELSLPLWEIWDCLGIEDRRETLAYIIWALSRCLTANSQSKLETALKFIREMSEECPVSGRVVNQSERGEWFEEPLHLAFQRWPISPMAAEIWAKVVQENPELGDSLAYVLRVIDHPSTMTMYVRWSGQKGGTMIDEIYESADPLTNPHRRLKVPSNKATRDSLWDLFQSESSDSAIRRIAFKFWAFYPQLDDLERLREINPEDPFFDEALKIRLQLHDETAKEMLSQRIELSAGFWCPYSPYFYGDADVVQVVIDNIESARSPWFGTMTFLKYFPAWGVKTLIETKREFLLSMPTSWLPLWKSGLPEALNFVQEALLQAGDELPKHFFHGSSGFPYPVSRQMLDYMLPILDRFSEREQKELARLAIRSGFVDWVKRNMPNLSTEVKRGLFHPSAEELSETLTVAESLVSDGFDALWRNREHSLFRILRVSDFDASEVAVVETVKEWVMMFPTENRIIVSAMIVADQGTSADLTWWECLSPQSDEADVACRNALYILKRRRWHA